MATGFSIKKWELNRATLDVIAEYGRVRFEEKEMRWLITNYLDDLQAVLVNKKDQKKKSAVMGVMDKLPEPDFIFDTDPKSLLEKLEFIHPAEYIKVVFERFHDSKVNLNMKLFDFKKALRVVNKSEETIMCDHKLYLTLILAALCGIITKDDVNLLKTVEVPQNKKNDFRVFEESLIREKKKNILNLLWNEEKENRVTF